MTKTLPGDLKLGFNRLLNEALSQGFAQLTPSTMFGEHRQLDENEQHEFYQLGEQELGIDAGLLRSVAELETGLKFDEWSHLIVCPKQPELELLAKRVLTSGQDGGLGVIFALRRL
ncbi:MAG: hypothetical protein WD926_00945 [Patescibacteria group bacterium]